jgi:hypothetical protein
MHYSIEGTTTWRVVKNEFDGVRYRCTGVKSEFPSKAAAEAFAAELAAKIPGGLGVYEAHFQSWLRSTFSTSPGIARADAEADIRAFLKHYFDVIERGLAWSEILMLARRFKANGSPAPSSPPPASPGTGPAPKPTVIRDMRARVRPQKTKTSVP